MMMIIGVIGLILLGLILFAVAMCFGAILYATTEIVEFKELQTSHITNNVHMFAESVAMMREMKKKKAESNL